MNAKTISRRRILKGAGVALALPWMESLAPKAAHAQATTPVRYLNLYFPNGTAAYWIPNGTGEGNAWQLSPILEPLAPMKEYVTVLGNVGNYSPFGGHIEPSHGHNCASAFTGVKASGDGNANNAISVDQVVADHLVAANGGTLPTPLHSLQVGLSTLDSYEDGIPGQHSRSISWKSGTEPLYKIVSPQGAFDRIVGGGLPMPMDNTTQMPDPLAERRRLLKQSALDFVRENALSVQQQLSFSDRAKLEQFLDSVRALEMRVASPTMPGLGTMCMAVDRPTETFGVMNTPPGYNRGEHATLMIDLVVMAIQCDVTRVVSFMLDDARSDFDYNFITERQFSDTGSTPGTAPVGQYHGLQHAGETNNGFATIGYWNAERANELASKLAAVTEGDSNVLQNSVITFMSGMHGGNHDGLDLPIALIGGGGGKLKKNNHLRFGDEKNVADMHLTLIQQVYGSTMTQFGTPMGGYTSGLLPEILA